MLSWPCVFAPSYIYWEAFPAFQQISCYPGTWALLWAIFIGSLQDLQQEWSKHYVWDLIVWVFNMLMLYSLFIVRGKCYSPGMFCGTTCSSCGLKVKHQPKFIPKVCGSFDLKLINCYSHFLEACYGPWRPNDQWLNRQRHGMALKAQLCDPRLPVTLGDLLLFMLHYLQFGNKLLTHWLISTESALYPIPDTRVCEKI